MSMQTEQTGTDLLTMENYFVRAEAGKRFLNYLIDLIIFYILAIGLGVLLALIAPSTVEGIADSDGFGLVDRIVTLILYALYMSVIEALFKGRSLGKLITGTRAVNLDGSNITTGTAFARGFSRAVPFCAFSAFGSPSNPWQDRWTDTMVIDIKKSELV